MKNNNNENSTRINDDLKGTEEADSNTTGLMEMCHKCLQSFDEENEGSSSKKNSKEKMASGSSISNCVKDGSRSKMTSGSKHLCGDTTERKNQVCELGYR